MKAILLSALLWPLLPLGSFATLYEIKLLTNAENVPDDFPTSQIMEMLRSKFLALVPDAVEVDSGERVMDYSARRLRWGGRDAEEYAEGKDESSGAPPRRLQLPSQCPKNCEVPRNWARCIANDCACTCSGRRRLQTRGDADLDLKSLERSLNADATQVASSYDANAAQQGFLATPNIDVGVRIKIVS